MSQAARYEAASTNGIPPTSMELFVVPRPEDVPVLEANGFRATETITEAQRGEFVVVLATTDTADAGALAWMDKAVSEAEAVGAKNIDIRILAKPTLTEHFDAGLSVGNMLRVPLERVKERFRLSPIDWRALDENGLAEPEFLVHPYLPKGAKVFAWGAASSAKSLCGLRWAVQLANDGQPVLYFSEENPLVEDVRRLKALDAPTKDLHLLHQTELDLARAEHVREVIRVAKEFNAALIVLDTLSAVWSGDESDNRAVVELDRNALTPIVRETEATVLILDHTGHKQAFVSRGGVSAGRGASAKGQKADVTMEFRSLGRGHFVLDASGESGHKNRFLAGADTPPVEVRVVDRVDGTIDFEFSEAGGDEKVRQVADVIVEALRAGPLNVRKIREAARLAVKKAGNETITKALKLLDGEDPPRVESQQEGSSKVYRIAKPRLAAVPTPEEDMFQ